jgi:GTP-binding protein EngB required for normal cell division
MNNTSRAHAGIFSAETRHGFNENHQRHLRTAFRYIDGLLNEAETILASVDSTSPFQQYFPDSTPLQRKVAHDYITRIREAMRRVLSELDISPPSPHCGALWGARTQLMGVSISLSELTNREFRGYGTLTGEADAKLDQIRSELQALVTRLESYLAGGEGGDIQARLQRLEQTTDEVRLLRELERISVAHGLVEFRGALAMLLDRLEATMFEIGVFGRVSSGKSSLLNHLLGEEYLPVGVTPVTALPTRVQYGPMPQAVIEFAEREPVTIHLSQLAEFCSEQKNPGNTKHVARVRVELPTASLREGVVFVDTPGLGSLAVAGAEETVAYLPRCDLGIMLIDAASTLTQEDLVVVEALYHSGATAMVLLSKVDLLTPAERDHAVDYVRRQLREQAQFNLPVHLVSVRGADAALCDHWFESELRPVLDQHKEMAAVAIKRKIGGLREAVASTLQQRLRTQSGAESPKSGQDREGALQALRDADMLLEAAERDARDAAYDMAALVAPILDGVAQRLAAGHNGVNADTAAIFTRTASQQINSVTEPLRQRLDQLRLRLAEALQSAEEATPQSAWAFDDLPTLAGLPGVDLAPVLAGLNGVTPPLPVRWNAALRQHWIRRRLGEQAEHELGKAFNEYGQRLRYWARETVAELRDAFTARADVCRAQLGMTGNATTTSDSTIEEDLHSLEQWGRPS